MLPSGIIDVDVSGPNALWVGVENKGDDIALWRDRWVPDLMNDTGVEGRLSIFGPGFTEELPRTANGNLNRSATPPKEGIGIKQLTLADRYAP